MMPTSHSALPPHIQLHAQRVKSYLQSDRAQSFKVLDTCRKDNGGIVKMELLKDWQPTTENKASYVAFVAAAGVASRWTKPLQSLIEAIDLGSPSEIAHAIADLPMTIRRSPLPQKLRALLSASPNAFEQVMLAQIAEELAAPKALYPAVEEGTTFLEIKRMEHDAYKRVDAEVYVCQDGWQEAFEQKLRRCKTRKNLPLLILTQGERLLTARFDDRGRAVEQDLIHPEGRRSSPPSLSLVPAGHGMLVHLFAEVANHFPQAKGLLIRNIDNISGTFTSAVGPTNTLLTLHSKLLTYLEHVREALKAFIANDDSKKLNALHEKTLDLLEMARASLHYLGTEESTFLSHIENATLHALWRVQFTLFHSTLSTAKALDPHITRDHPSAAKALLGMFNRPLNILGQVPNTGTDVGGTPVFAETPLGKAKVCLELPHFSEEDRRKFLSHAKVATHFNPVIIATELQQLGSSEIWDNPTSPFWLVAEKSFRGGKVYYHETLLSEVLGNSVSANVLFVECPRTLFNPHKTITDATDKSLKDWCVKNRQASV